MRALGPGSVSSFLKIVLEVVHAALWAALAALLVTAVAILVFQPFVNSVYEVDLHGLTRHGVQPAKVQPLRLALAVLGGAVYVAGLAAVFNRLRRIFGALTIGDPFQPENVGRLQVVGALLTALELWSYVLPMLLRWALPGSRAHGDINFTAWFSILVVFVLAEVFREGARLRQDAELTI
jgi:uncharacterized membrane protein